MMLSEDKISHLSHVLFKGLTEKKLIEPIDEESKIRAEIKRVIIAELKIGEEINAIVRKKLLSFSRKIAEGSPEWEVLYKKFYKEEEIKRGRAS
ncbi:MAG: DUF507 family protein [Nitrospirae bacterium]|nr:DUF507 family protein [Nitrospirota bacterium]